MISHSKCAKCLKKSHVSELKDSSDSVGQICINEEKCKERKVKNNVQSHNKRLWRQ